MRHAVSALDAVHFAPGKDLAAHRSNVVAVCARDDAVVDDAGDRDKDGFDAARVRLAFTDAAGVNDLHAFDAILDAAIEEILQQRQFAFFGSHDQLADAAILDALAV